MNDELNGVEKARNEKIRISMDLSKQGSVRESVEVSSSKGMAPAILPSSSFSSSSSSSSIIITRENTMNELNEFDNEVFEEIEMDRERVKEARRGEEEERVEVEVKRRKLVEEASNDEFKDALDFDQLDSIVCDKPIALKTTDGDRLIFIFEVTQRYHGGRIRFLSGPGVSLCHRRECDESFTRSQLWGYQSAHFQRWHGMSSSAIAKIREMGVQPKVDRSASMSSLLSDQPLLISRILAEGYRPSALAKQSALRAVSAIANGNEAPLRLGEMTEVICDRPIIAETKCGSGSILLAYRCPRKVFFVRLLTSPHCDGTTQYFFPTGWRRSELFKKDRERWSKYHNLTSSAMSKLESLLFYDKPPSGRRRKKGGSFSSSKPKSVFPSTFSLLFLPKRSESEIHASQEMTRKELDTYGNGSNDQLGFSGNKRSAFSLVSSATGAPLAASSASSATVTAPQPLPTTAERVY